jgi:hypothetical protein
MTTYGFRLYNASLRLRGGSASKPFGNNGVGLGAGKTDLAPLHFSQHAQALLQAHLNEKKRGLPLAPSDNGPPSAPTRSTPVFRVISSGVYGRNLVTTVEEAQNRGFDKAFVQGARHAQIPPVAAPPRPPS